MMANETEKQENGTGLGGLIEPVVICGYWYCPTCKEEVDGSRVTFSEHHDSDCNTPVVWVEADHVAVPLELIKAVAHIGVDFGYGKYELEQEHIAKAREIYEANT